jgi:hypothetical protein
MAQPSPTLDTLKSEGGYPTPSGYPHYTPCSLLRFLVILLPLIPQSSCLTLSWPTSQVGENIPNKVCVEVLVGLE